MDIENKILDVIQKNVEEAGYVVDKVIYEREEKTNFLRIVVDKNGVVDIDDCVIVSKIINPLIDDADLIEESYILDVCSKEKGCD